MTRVALYALLVLALLAAGGAVGANRAIADAPPPCRPRLSYRCQPPPRTPQQAVRRTLNRAGLGWAWRTAERIVRCESAWRVNAIGRDTNGYYSRGLWQINDRWWAYLWQHLDWSDPVDNTRAAVAVYRRSGNSWRPWSCY